MHRAARLLSSLALILTAAFIPAAAASAKAPSTAKWAKQNHLKGSWKTKDTDKDGLKNSQEFKLGTNPRKADTDGDGLKDGDEVQVGDDPLTKDTDGDGVKDGAEHAGVVTAFDGDTITIRQFTGGKLTATLSDDASCYTSGNDAADDDSSGDDDSADDSSDDSSSDDGGDSADDTGDDSADDTGDDASDDTSVDVGDDSGDDDSGDDDCTTAGIDTGTLVRKLDLTRDGGQFFTDDVELADV
jgi:hypothetical protein